jgi:hypothetical protein
LSDAKAGRPAGRRGRRIVVIALVVAALAVVAVRIWGRGRVPWVGKSPVHVTRVIPAGTRVKVELFNATDTRGLARTAAAVLRDAGFDVVFFGNTPERHDSSVVRDRSNHPDWATIAAGVLRPARTEVRPDSGRLVDLTILIGGSWRAPTEPLRP